MADECASGMHCTSTRRRQTAVALSGERSCVHELTWAARGGNDTRMPPWIVSDRLPGHLLGHSTGCRRAPVPGFGDGAD